MLSSYILIALENLKRQRVFSAIKVLSLAIGLGCSILVLMHVQYALSFDKHFPNWQNTYRLVTSLTTDRRIDTDLTADIYAPLLKLDYPQIEHIARIAPERGTFARGDQIATDAFYWAEPGIIDIFSLDFISGDPATALEQPNTIVLSNAAARKYFPDEEALGQTLTLDNQAELLVTGVIRNLPENTHLDLQMLISIGTGRQLFGNDFMGGKRWAGFAFTMTYLTLPSQQEARAIDEDLASFVERNVPDDQRAAVERYQLALSLQPLADIYLDARSGFGDGNMRPRVLLGLGTFAILILLTSCINFANLSLSQVRQRGKEIGIRKALGARRGQIVNQFLFESLLLTFLALLLALPVVYFAIPVYNSLTGTNFTAAAMLHNGTILTMPLFVLATGIVSGLLPAFVLAHFEPASIKDAGAGGCLSRLVRVAVTVTQFGFSTTLIILVLAINLQIRYLNTMELGFDKNNLVVLDSTYNQLASTPADFDYAAMVNELEQHPGILSIGQSFARPPDYAGYNAWRLPGFAPGESRSVLQQVVDADYFDTMGLTLLAGRWFSDDFASDFSSVNGLPPADSSLPVPGIVITPYVVDYFGFATSEDALDEIFLVGAYAYRVIGVVDDFHLSGGLEDKLGATGILRATTDPLQFLFIRIDPAQAQSALRHIDEIWARHRPDIPINRIFYDQIVNDLVYARTNGISKAALFASIITILISALGLYALAYYSTQRRTREVGIRKVVGASSRKIVTLLTWDFLKPVLAACALACMAGYFVIDRYFQQFSSRVEISPLLYVAVTLGTLLVAILTVASQCYRTANADPIRSLRYE